MTRNTAEQPDSDGEGDERTWVASGFTARVIKNEDDEGWAVTMTRDGESEPVLVSPWTMGRDKKNPKPLNHADFKTLLKGARDVVTRHEAHARAQRHRSVTILDAEGSPVRVDLDIAADEDDPHAMLSAWDPVGEKLAERRVAPNFKLSSASAGRWVASGFGDV
ncbi:hypothetical protein [Nannocystis sp. SCPEA4]|uniref:hypothetical protein n=1 Tax=Nannocystis sp. SCPEA4 TaxID=2996787 RepID=UPI00226FF848|nr:hypothetical protein [Nannocystis sp. SCPEA4]MCY1057677.1 hypothetical protein [Nannocystis sp. SCPEA4]